MDKGFKVHILFLLWLGIIAGIPFLIFGESSIAICGIIAVFGGLLLWGSAEKGPKNTFRHDMPLTYAHFGVFIIYAVVAVLTIAFGALDYDGVTCLSRGIFFFITYPVLLFFIESYIIEKKKKKFYATLSIGQLYEEQNSREGVPWYLHDKYLEFTRKSIWMIKELRHYNDIILQDVHFSRRVKSVTADELKKYIKLDRVTWIRPPEYYDMIIDAIRKRASEEVNDWN